VGMNFQPDYRRARNGEWSTVAGVDGGDGLDKGDNV